MGAIEHASHFGWEMTARKTLDVYDWALEEEENNAKYKLFKNQ
jgi:D-inositol-3-phosphate glycosyltransferase